MTVTRRHTQAAGPGKAEIARFCRGLPGATESIQWGDDLVFKVGGKMFAVLGPWSAKAPHLAIKASDDSFEILTRQANIVPAPYLARAKWVQPTALSALPRRDLFAYLSRAHANVVEGLSRNKRIDLGIEKVDPVARTRAKKTVR